MEHYPAPTNNHHRTTHEQPPLLEPRLDWPVTDEIDDLRLITIADAADRLSLCRSKVYELIAEQKLPTIKIGRSRRISLDDLRTFVAQHRAA